MRNDFRALLIRSSSCAGGSNQQTEQELCTTLSGSPLCSHNLIAHCTE